MFEALRTCECADVVMEVLHILRGLAPALDALSVNKCLPALAPLLASVSTQGNRFAICQALEEFSRVDSSVSSVVCDNNRSCFGGDFTWNFCSGFVMVLPYYLIVFVLFAHIMLAYGPHMLSLRRFITCFVCICETHG